MSKNAGSMLEGGGQILRNAASLAAITKTAIIVNNIRAKRSKPGLRPQHLTGLELVANLSQGVLQGGSVGSTQITFLPGASRCIHATADTGTAGSCMLLAQISLPCLLFSHPSNDDDVSNIEMSNVELKGGTDAAMAPPVEYMLQVFVPTLRKHLEIDINIELVRRGFFPRGQGLVKLHVRCLPPETVLPPIKLTSRGDLTEICISAFTSGKVKASVGDRMLASAEQIVKNRLGDSTRAVEVRSSNVHEPFERAFGDGCGIILVAKTSRGCLLGGSALGERGVTAETVGQKAAIELMDVLESGACVDDWLMDQLVIFMALADGESEVVGREPTLHTQTAIAVAETMTTATFKIECMPEQKLWKVKCNGAGIRRRVPVEKS